MTRWRGLGAKECVGQRRERPLDGSWAVHEPPLRVCVARVRGAERKDRWSTQQARWVYECVFRLGPEERGGPDMLDGSSRVGGSRTAPTGSGVLGLCRPSIRCGTGSEGTLRR